MPDSIGVVQSNPMNKTQGKHIHNFSTFSDSLSYTLANTPRFGEYTPSFVMEGVENDEIRLNTRDLIDSLSLKAPFKGSIRKIKESYKVPLMAIIPMNWDKVYVQPSNGDDTPLDANCAIQKWPELSSTFWLAMFIQVCSNVPGSTATDSDVAAWLTALMRCLVTGEYLYSFGSLLNVLGYKQSAQFRYTKLGLSSYDSFVDYILSNVFKELKSVGVNVPYDLSSGTYWVNHYLGLAAGSVYSNGRASSFRMMLDDFRENPTCYFDYNALEYNSNLAAFLSNVASLVGTGLIFDYNNIVFILPSAASTFDTTTDITSLNPNTLNLSRVLSYQLICAHFYTNSSIDPIYSADIYRQYINSLQHYILGANLAERTFTYNGVACVYDYLSGERLNRVLCANSAGTGVFGFSYAQLSAPVDPLTNPNVARLSVFAAVFGFRRSLRFGDYFVGSRPRPLAPINTDVAVNSNQVSVIDITRGIQAQRFANSVMRSRQKIEEYVKSLFGRSPAPDYHNPFFLTRQAEVIFGDEVQNTANTQVSDANSRTANFSSNVDRFTFTFHNDDMHPCIYMQIIHFDVKRFYSRSVERQFLHLDRFDMFNPDFQYIGDQPIYGIELGYPQGGYLNALHKFRDVFAYTTRDMEYKQRFNQCSGGFVENLPGWILSDNDRSRVSPGYLDPDFIRSYNTELDQFYLSLTGFSLGSYFHFICVSTNNVDAKRPMAVDPQILG